MNHLNKKLKRVFIPFLVFAGVISTSFNSIVDGDDYFGVKTVVIDAGHGGHDGGCGGSFSNEKDVALSIALKLGSYIKKELKDVKVIYTRETDVFIPLYERAAIANKAKADLFICVHVNAGGNVSTEGTETYVMGLHKTAANLKVSQRENSSILLEDDYKTKYSDFDPNSVEDYIIMNMTLNAFLAQSQNFANKVETQFENRVGRHSRGVKQAGFLVLHQTAMPSVLIETGFLTNVNEEKFLNSDKGQDYMASAIFRAFRDYKNEIEGKKGDEKPINEKPIISVEEKKEEPLVEVKQHVKKNKKGVTYKVQIATSSEKKELIPENFKGLKTVNLYEAGGLYRYTVGNEKSIEAANKLKLKLKEKGFENAFVVAFLEGKRISMNEAVKHQKN